MAKISYTQGRQLLKEACQVYLVHNKAQFEELQVSYNDFRSFEPYGELKPGFHEWAQCQYYILLDDLLFANEEFCHGLILRSYLSVSTFIARGSSVEKYKGLVFLRGYEDWRVGASVDHNDPEIILQNLQALVSLVSLILDKRGFNKERVDYPQVTSLPCDSPRSLQIHHTLWQLGALLRFAARLPDFKGTRVSCAAGRLIYTCCPIFEGYIKGIVVAELQKNLENRELNDKEAVKAVEAQLVNGMTFEILTKNRQSECEKRLKLLSVISILIGVGIFTTLGLVCKRLYDSGGTSINFFKPLSENFYDSMRKNY